MLRMARRPQSVLDVTTRFKSTRKRLGFWPKLKTLGTLLISSKYIRLGADKVHDLRVLNRYEATLKSEWGASLV